MAKTWLLDWLMSLSGWAIGADQLLFPFDKYSLHESIVTKLIEKKTYRMTKVGIAFVGAETTVSVSKNKRKPFSFNT